MKLNKSKINLIIDIIMFINLMILAGVGFLIKYVLLPGFERNEKYGRDVELYFLGVDRHQWGTIHLIISFALLFLLLWHIVLHWKMIKSIYKKLIPGKKLRNILGYSFIAISLIFAVVPFFIYPEIGEPVLHYRNSLNRQGNNQIYESNNKQIEESDNHQKPNDSHIRPIQNNNYKRQQNNKGRYQMNSGRAQSTIDVDGSMTINEVSEKYNIPAKDIARQINVPANYVNERLGRLKRQYGFDMDELRKYIEINSK